MTSVRRTLVVGGMVVLAAVGAWLVRREPDVARWLRVVIPAGAVPGKDFPVQVDLYVTRALEYLRVDLHWVDERGIDRGVLGSAPAQATGIEERTYQFRVPVPPQEGLTGLFGVVYVSPTGRWQDRVRVCRTERIPLVARPDPAVADKRIRVRLFEEFPARVTSRHDAAPVRGLTAALFLGVAAVCGWNSRAGRRRADAARLRWDWLAGACLVAAGWEAFAVEARLGEVLREFALAHGLYSQRQLFQQVASGLIGLGSVGLALNRLRRDHAQPFAVTFSAVDVYWGVAAISFISLHDVDTWLVAAVFSLPAVQFVKLMAAVVAGAAAIHGAVAGRNG